MLGLRNRGIMEVEFEVVQGPMETKPEITRVEYDLDSLIVHIEPEYDAEPIIVSFDSSIGFRVLDEGNLLEFWEKFNLNSGWLYRIISGGWFDLESKRNGFVSQHHSDVQEYLIIGVNECVSVLAGEAPTVVLPSSNKASNPSP